MPEHRETRILPYTADLMYRVVADVEAYPHFLPWVVALRILSRAREGGRELLTAEMAVGYGGLRERYTSLVTLDEARRRIDVVQTKGPFQTLENHWHFEPRDPGCSVTFVIAFEFRSQLLSAAAGAALSRVILKMADAFEARARVLSEQG